MKNKPMSCYPGTDVRRAVEKICEEDHGRPAAHMIEMAMKAFVTLWRSDKYQALKLVDQFDQAGAR